MSASDRFPLPLIIRAVPHWERAPEVPRSKQIYILTAEFHFISARWSLIRVPVGFDTDFGSVPAFTKWAVDDDDPDLLFGAIIHDWLYAQRGWIDSTRVLTRKDADHVLREAMQSLGAPAFKTWIVFQAVRLAGGRTWAT